MKKKREDLYFLHSFLIELLDFLISIRTTSARTIRDVWTFNILEEKRDRLEIRLRILWFFLLIRHSRVVCSIHDESKKHLLLEKGDLETTNFLPPRFSKVEHFLSSDKCDFKRTPSPPSFLLHSPPPLSLFFLTLYLLLLFHPDATESNFCRRSFDGEDTTRSKWRRDELKERERERGALQNLQQVERVQNNPRCSLRPPCTIGCLSGCLPTTSYPLSSLCTWTSNEV